MLPYIDKRAELLRCLIDVYLAAGNEARCRELLAEIDRINEEYREQGICREVPPEIRGQISIGNEREQVRKSLLFFLRNPFLYLPGMCDIL